MFPEIHSKLKQLSFKHQNNKVWYYFINNFRRIFPTIFFRNTLNGKLKDIVKFDQREVERRVNYYNKLEVVTPLASNTKEISELKLGKKMKVYYFDSYEYIRYFNPGLKAEFLFGDIIHVPEVPSFVKSRPINGDIANSIVLKLGKIRHFRLINDSKKFENKKDVLIFRGQVFQPHRRKFLEMYYGHPMCDIGQTNKQGNPQFLVDRKTVDEHLDYKFILSLEGNDVASNLKWVMSSNSLAVMPTPNYETWFMEGTLIADYHYVHINDDYSNLEEKLRYYIEHTDKALEIIAHAHEFVNQFRNKKQEDLISLMVIQKYFEKTGQQV